MFHLKDGVLLRTISHGQIKKCSGILASPNLDDLFVNSYGFQRDTALWEGKEW